MTEGDVLKIFKRVLIGLVIVLGLGAVGGYFYWQQSVYEPSTQAEQSFKQGVDKDDYLLFESQKIDGTSNGDFFILVRSLNQKVIVYGQSN